MESGSINQPVTERLREGPLAGLLSCASYSLADWYATPLSTTEAGTLLSLTQQAIQRRLRGGESCVPLQVLLQICRFWLEALPEPPGESWRYPARSEREAALQELVHGQLLVSRKLRPALFHLSLGFRHAAPLLETADYFRLLREHELLACLPLSGEPAAAQDLTALLNEAAVIRRLQRSERRQPAWPHLDTLG
jgi:hypothetical protein